ncbi:MAG: hypothetical protein WCJ30_06320 [Deltaproteobacteria bacterium]
MYVLLWSEGAVSRWQPEALGANAALRARMETENPVPRRVRRWVQPDGTPLVELWLARAGTPR